MKPIKIIQKLNESVNDTFDRFAKDLETALLDAGYQIDSQYGGKNYSNEDGMVYYTVKKGNAGIQIDLYQGGHNISDFENDTIGIGGDNGCEKIVYPRVQSNWDYDNATPIEHKMEVGEEVYAIFKDISKTTIPEVVNIVKEAFDKAGTDFESQLESVFDSVKKDESGGYEINNSGIGIDNECLDDNGKAVEGFSIYSVKSTLLFPNVEGSSSFDIQAPRYIRDKNGVEYGDYIAFEGPVDINKIKSVFDEINSKKKEIDPSKRDANGYATIIESNLKEDEAYDVAGFDKETELNKLHENDLYVYSDANSYEKEEAEANMHNFESEAPELTFKLRLDDKLWFIDFIGKYDDIKDYLSNKLDWYDDDFIDSHNLITPYKED